jgi:adenosylcobinamide kinase/adenosylcobinamide-phosphate guanylyltransferase
VQIVVTGSAAQAWPVPGCSCVACRDGPAATTGLRIGDGTLVSGRFDTPDGPRALAAGERFERGGLRLAALPGPAGGGPAVVVGTAGRTVLWCDAPGALPDATLDALAGAGVDVAALDLRGAEGHPDPLHLAHTLARLAAVGALAPGADVVALGRTHALNPEQLARRLGRWGARVAADGSVLPGVPVPVNAPLRTLVLGPASSGKSALAEDLLAAEPEVVYAATGPSADDAAWGDRVRAHRSRRPAWWRTVETRQLPELLADPGPPLLVDALGTWVAAAMDRADAWDDAPGWRPQVEGEVDAVVAGWRQARRQVVAVGEEVGWGIVPADRGVAAFREVLGDLARRLGEQSERVLLVVAGRVVELT